MQEPAPPHVASANRGCGETPLTAGEIEAIISDFRDWLSRLPDASSGPPPEETVDLMTLVRGFTALRQEINLQTRAVRAQSEQAGQALEALANAEQKTKSDTALDARALLKALVEARDSLALARAQVAKSRDLVGTLSAPPAVELSVPPWARWLGLDGFVQRAIGPLLAWSQAAANSAAQSAPLIDSLLVGYAMSLQRLDRAIEQSGLRRVDCVGSSFDSETMEVVEVVADPSRSASEVIEEVRPGYFLNGSVFRFAQVRVARP